MEKEKAEIIFESKDAKGLKLIEDSGLEIVTLEIEINGVIEEHILPVDILFFVNKGLGELKIDNKIEIMEKWHRIFVPAGTSRGWKNIGKKKLIITGIKYLR